MDNGGSPLTLVLSTNGSRVNAYAVPLIVGVLVGMLFDYDWWPV